MSERPKNRREAGLPYYRKDGSRFLLCAGEQILDGMDSVSICYSDDGNAGDGGTGVVLHKHGSFELVEKWAEATRKKLAEAGPFGQTMADEICVLVTDSIDVDTLNWWLDNCTALGTYLDDHELRRQVLA